MPAIRVIAEMPLRDLWEHSEVLKATRIRRLGSEGIKALLQLADVDFIIANVGHPPRWIKGKDRFDQWKRELQPKLVSSEQDSWRLEDFPMCECFVASEWKSDSGRTIVLFEMYH